MNWLIFFGFLIANDVERERMWRDGQTPPWSMRHPLLSLALGFACVIGLIVAWASTVYLWKPLPWVLLWSGLAVAVVWIPIRLYRKADARYGVQRAPRVKADWKVVHQHSAASTPLNQRRPGVGVGRPPKSEGAMPEAHLPWRGLLVKVAVVSLASMVVVIGLISVLAFLASL